MNIPPGLIDMDPGVSKGLDRKHQMRGNEKIVVFF